MIRRDEELAMRAAKARVVDLMYHERDGHTYPYVFRSHGEQIYRCMVCGEVPGWYSGVFPTPEGPKLGVVVDLIEHYGECVPIN